MRRVNLEPFALQKNKKLTLHGDTRIDPYYWMNQRDHPDVLKYLEEENKYTEYGIKKFSALSKNIFDELMQTQEEMDQTLPYKEGSFYHFSRSFKKKDYPIYYRQRSLKAKPQKVLDVNQLAKNQVYCSVQSPDYSPSENVMAYAIDTIGRRQYDIVFYDLKLKKEIDFKVKSCTGEYIWISEEEVLYIQQDPKTLLFNKLYLANWKTKETKFIHEEKDPTFSLSIYESRSKKFVFLYSSSMDTSEIQVFDKENPELGLKIFSQRKKRKEYLIDHYTGESFFYIRVNDQKSHFNLMKTSLDKTSSQHWQKVYEFKPSCYFQSFLIFQDYIVMKYSEKGQSYLKVKKKGSRQSYEIRLPDSIYRVGISLIPEQRKNQLRIQYESLGVPPRIYDIDLKTQKLKLKKARKISSSIFKPQHFEAKNLWATSRDGVRIPISLILPKNTKGPIPIMVYGYGSYGFGIEPYFSLPRISLLRRGVGIAIAHIRGGDKLGQSWYEQGKFLKKKNTFNDFIDCTKFLIKKKIADPNKIVAMGGSAGGLLMGAVINDRPELFAGVLAAVPFVDCLTTMLDETIPLTTLEYEEWGNPNQKKYYEYIKSYSPYDNIKAQNYPPLMITSGYHDSQVQYWEPTKWTAKLRALKTDHNPLYLYTDFESGHGGASSKKKFFKEIGREFGFLLYCLGIEN